MTKHWAVAEDLEEEQVHFIFTILEMCTQQLPKKKR